MAIKIITFIAAVLKALPFIAIAYGLYRLMKLLRALAIGRLSYTRELSESEAFAGDSVYMTETVYNKTLFPLFFVDIEGYLYRGLSIDGRKTNGKDMQHFVSCVHLLPFMQIKRTHKITCLHRGVYTLDSVSVFANGSPINFEAPVTLTVYPELLHSAPMLPTIATAVGNHITNRALISDPFSLSGIRDYRPGDTMRQINYKATARSAYSPAALKVNNYDFCQNYSFVVCLNFHVQWEDHIDLAEYESIMESGLSVCATALREASAAGGRIGFAANCACEGKERFLTYKMNSGKHHFLDIMKCMAEMKFTDGMSY
ncbi:MAG: DUF58 domain-containing protein, partial [Clostridia bacterium]|nr:DUF58 domain-containing protein [Clostridia bacterium]